MKRITTISILIITIALTAFSTTPKLNTYKKINWQKAEKNYLFALTSENVGVRQSATNFIAEYQLTGALQPLIDVLQTDKVEQLRMAAAVALVQLGLERGIDAVKDAAIYDGSEKVAKFCERLVNTNSEKLSLR